MFCKNCGAKIKDGAKFCGKCGTPVSDSTQVPSVEPNAKKKTNIISIILIGVIVLTVLLGAVAIIGSIATGKASSSGDYSSSEEISDSNGDNTSFVAPAANKNVDFCYEGFSWDMSYDEAYDVLYEMSDGNVNEAEDSENNNRKDIKIHLYDYEGLKDVDCHICVSFYDDKMKIINLNLNRDNSEYSLEEAYNYMIDKCEEMFPGAESTSEDDSQKWEFYGNDNSLVGFVEASSHVYENNTDVHVAYVFY